MWKKLREWLKAPVLEGDPEKTRQAGVLWIVLSAALIAVPVYLASFYVNGKTPNNEGWFIALGLAGVFVAMLFAVRFGYVRIVGYVLSTAFWIAGIIPAYIFGGLREMALQFQFLVLILAGTTIGIRAVTGYFVLSVGALGFLLFGEYQGWITYSMTPPTTNDDVIVPVLALLLSTLLLRNAIRSLMRANEQSRESAVELESANADLQNVQDVLAQQSADLQRRATFLEATTAVAQETALLLDQPELLFDQIVETISTQLGMYHVGLYVFDGTGDHVQLIAASSVGGKRLVQESFRLPVSDRAEDRSIAGWVAAHGDAYLVTNVDEEPRFRILANLLETRSEIALPLLSQGQVIGVLDLQSNIPSDFNEVDMVMLRVLAGQAGMVINNAQLVSQLGEAVDTQRRLSGEIGRENWLELIRGAEDASYVSTGEGVEKSAAVWSQEMAFAVNNGKATVSPDNPRVLALPVRARGEVVAVIDATLPEGLQTWTPAAIAAAEAMAEQLGTALEGARLYQQTMQRATTEQMTREVTAAMRSSLNVDDVLQAALREISEVLEVQQVQVRLGTAGEEASA